MGLSIHFIKRSVKQARVTKNNTTKYDTSNVTVVVLYVRNLSENVTVYRKTGHNAACVNIEKRSIDFLKMYCFKPTEGNG